jgi:hypothetical protein
MRHELTALPELFGPSFSLKPLIFVVEVDADWMMNVVCLTVEVQDGKYKLVDLCPSDLG